ncbi:hypothetical protein [Rheinheimera sp. EpRS3]|uniref:hypothetical protein n=1 Tax=Rheinheimera sp. EpRS3 TaxID=1712383 RepID=UPI000AED0EEF|nr:hypothetical protein [Rheinheimera sp. EpRS3]
MENNNILQELKITELEERVEFGLCGGSGGGGGDGGGEGPGGNDGCGDGAQCQEQ